jgi:hypothetical protein
MKPRPLNIEASFALLVAAAVAGKRCPQNEPFGPIQRGTVERLIEAGRIRSEVYAVNFRRVTILTGEHAGKSTAAHPKGFAPYLVNGVRVDRGQHLAPVTVRTPDHAPSSG